MQKLDPVRFSYRRFRHYTRLAGRRYNEILRHPQWAGGALSAPISLWSEYNRAKAYARDYQQDLLDGTGRHVSA